MQTRSQKINLAIHQDAELTYQYVLQKTKAPLKNKSKNFCRLPPARPEIPLAFQKKPPAQFENRNKFSKTTLAPKRRKIAVFWENKFRQFGGEGQQNSQHIKPPNSFFAKNLLTKKLRKGRYLFLGAIFSVKNQRKILLKN